MPTIQPRPEAKAAHMDALRLIGHHRPILDGFICDRDTCTRPAHWRIYKDANPRLAEILIVCGAYEIYEAVGPDGYPGHDTGFAVVERADGPSGMLYVGSIWLATWAEAVRYACEKSIANISAEMGEDEIAPPMRVAGVAYRR